jgi:cold shock CspA family protein
MEYGIIRKFVPGEGKNYGFIEPDAGGRSVFFHIHHFNGRDQGRVPNAGDRVVFERSKIERRGPKVREFDFDPFISFGDVCHEKLSMTLQSGAEYVGGFLERTPDLSDNLRFQGDRAMYHSLRIHRDDVPRFVQRVKKWEKAKHNGKTVLIYASETEFFFSNVFGQIEVPEGFVPITTRLPIKVKPYELLVDGIIETPAQFVQHDFIRRGARKHIPNPMPHCEPAYSGYYKAPE